MVTRYTKEDWRRMFDNYDGNQDGTIRVSGLERLMMVMGYNPTRREVLAFMKELDKNHDDVVDFEEFYEYMSRQPDPMGELRDAFRILDKNGDGVIDKEEFKGLLCSGETSEDEIEDLFKLVDENNDGKVQYEEFIQLFMSGKQKEQFKKQEEQRKKQLAKQKKQQDKAMAKNGPIKGGLK